MNANAGGLWLWFACAVPAGLPAQADAPPARRAVVDLGELLAPIRVQHGVPALGAAVLVDGELAAIGASGVRKHGDDTLVAVDDRWHLGSCTKAMTATLLARQVDAGKLAWTTTVAAGLPDLVAGMDAAARTITIEQLLRHRAGLPSRPPDALWRELFHFAGTDREARTEVAGTLLARAPEAEPGQRFLYSNAGYMIAGAIAERAGGATWAELIRRELFEPLGMRAVGFGPPGAEARVEQPWGHRRGANGPVPMFADNPPSLGPAGTVHATLADWAKFVRLHLGVAVAGSDGRPLVSLAAMQALHTPPAGADYALGWGVRRRPWAPGPILMHNGSNTMWFCVAWLAPEVKFAVLVTCNQGGAAAACDDVTTACVQRFRPADAR